MTDPTPFHPTQRWAEDTLTVAAETLLSSLIYHLYEGDRGVVNVSISITLTKVVEIEEKATLSTCSPAVSDQNAVERKSGKISKPQSQNLTERSHSMLMLSSVRAFRAILVQQPPLR